MILLQSYWVLADINPRSIQWKRSVRNQGKDEFQEFLKLLSMAQRAEDRDFDTSRVILFINFSCQNWNNNIYQFITRLFIIIVQLHPEHPFSMSASIVQLSSQIGLLSWYHSFIHSFKLIYLMEVHVQSCTERPRWPHECFFCSMEFETKNALNVHMRHCKEK